MAALPVATVSSGYSWGGNDHGQLGTGSTGRAVYPVPVSLPANTTTVSTGRDYTVVIAAGRVLAWGRDDDGQLGDGKRATSLTPIPVALPRGVKVVALDSSEGHSLALTDDGRVFGWGSNSRGELGDGSTTDRSRPTQVKIPAGVWITAIGTGVSHSLAVAASGAVYAWGAGTGGQLGDGAAKDRHRPVAVALPAGVKVTAVGAGTLHSIALTSTGAVFAWGGNDDGQLGNGSTTASSRPIVVPGVHATAVAAGSKHSAAIVAGGAIMAWGANHVGQLGDGSRTNRTSPVTARLPSGISVGSLSVLDDTSIAVSAAGTSVLSWGANVEGSLGDGTTTARTTPKAVVLRRGEHVLVAAAGSTGAVVVVRQGPITGMILTPAEATGWVGRSTTYAAHGRDAQGHDLGALGAGITLRMTGGSCTDAACKPAKVGLQIITATVTAGPSITARAQLRVFAPAGAASSIARRLPNTGPPGGTYGVLIAGVLLVLGGAALVWSTRLRPQRVGPFAGRHRRTVGETRSNR